MRPLEAVDGDQAIVVLKRTARVVELLFANVQMPGNRDRFALAREAARRWPKTGTPIASGNVRPGPDAFPEGAMFVGKPFSAQLMHEHPRKILPPERRLAAL